MLKKAAREIEGKTWVYSHDSLKWGMSSFARFRNANLELLGAAVE
jgi:hypothetical protein